MTTDDPSDADLWARAAAGSGSAFATLFDRHAKAVYNHCFRLTASWSAAEDLAQSTFLHAWRKRNAVHLEHDSALPWLLGWPPTRNHRRGLGRWLRSPSGCPPNRWPPTHADDVAARVDDERLTAEVLAAVRRLSRAQQEALAMCVWSGVSYSDAAAVLGIAESSVRARVSKARARLHVAVAGHHGPTRAGQAPCRRCPGCRLPARRRSRRTATRSSARTARCSTSSSRTGRGRARCSTRRTARPWTARWAIRARPTTRRAAPHSRWTGWRGR